MIFNVQTGPYDGSPDELMDDVEDLNEALKQFDNSKVTGDRTTITTTSGLTGVSEPFTGVNVEGSSQRSRSTAPVSRSWRLALRTPYEANQNDITAMIESLSSTTPEGDA